MAHIELLLKARHGSIRLDDPTEQPEVRVRLHGTEDLIAGQILAIIDLLRTLELQVAQVVDLIDHQQYHNYKDTKDNLCYSSHSKAMF